MDFYEVLAKVIEILQREGRTSDRALKRQFELDDEYLEDLKIELIEVRECTVDRDNKMLVWTGDPVTFEPDGRDGVSAEMRFQALLPAVIGLLQTQRRVTYRTLKYVFGISEALLVEIREELTFRQLAIDENEKGLVWLGEAPSSGQPVVAVTNQPDTTTTAPAISTRVICFSASCYGDRFPHE